MNKRLAERLDLEADDLERVGYSSTDAYLSVACKAERMNEPAVAEFFFRQAELCDRKRRLPIAAQYDDAVCESPLSF